MSWRIAVDTGGTFTDLVARHPDGRQVRLKVPSTPADPGAAVRDALAALEAQVGPVEGALRHGTTVATNAILERRFARAVLICTAGFEDLLALRRQARPDLYALHPVVPPPVIPRERVLPIAARRGPAGAVITPLPDLPTWLARHHAALAAANAIAICLLHAYADRTDEAAVAAAVRDAFPDTPVTVSHELAPVFREYERAATCALNACLAPVMARYLDRLADRLGDRPLQVMSSAGGLMGADDAAAAPVRTALSGPAGGVRGAWTVGQRTGDHALLAFDMGGTSTDVSVLAGPLLPVDDGAVDGHPLRVPLLPIDTVGAGGGSLAWIDAGGALQVGPRSAGAVPGPACYGRGGVAPTVTDAHVALGRLTHLLGGAMALDRPAATDAIATVGTAEAIIAVAEANMARACKRVALSQGLDPRRLTLIAFGGAGGLHACGLADALESPTVLFPAAPGVLSAEGILSAPVESSTTRSIFAGEADWTADRIAAAWHAVAIGDGDLQVLAECRYAGQTHTLSVDVSQAPPSPDQLRRGFEAAHRARYGHTLPRPIEWVSLRAFARRHPPALAEAAPAAPLRRVGPCAIEAYGATLWLPAHWAAERLPTGDWRCTRIAAIPPSPQLAVEVFRQRVAAIAEAMGEVLMRAAFSANIKERRDFSCAIFDAQGQMIAHAAHIPVHLGSTPLSVRAAIDAVPMRAGQAVILNDPFAGGTHLPDVTVVEPVFIGETLDDGGVSNGRFAESRLLAARRDDDGVLEAHRGGATRLPANAAGNSGQNLRRRHLDDGGVSHGRIAESRLLAARRDDDGVLEAHRGGATQRPANAAGNSGQDLRRRHLDDGGVSNGRIAESRLLAARRDDDGVLEAHRGGATQRPANAAGNSGQDLRRRHLAFFVANRAHHADVGGVSAGSLPSPRRADGSVRPLQIDDEGVRIEPTPLDAASRARFVSASRVPIEREGDLQAQEAANRHGAERLRALVGQMGQAAVDAATATLLDYAERRMRATLSALPDGVYRAVDALDDDGVDAAPVPIPVTLTITGDTACVDFTAAPDAVAGPLNAVRAIAISAVFYCFRCLAGAALPANAGLMRPIAVRTRPGSVVDAQPPAAVSSGNVETSQRLVDVLFAALAQAAPDRVPAASCGSMNNVLFGGVVDGRPFVHYETLAGGAGAGPAGPGADGIHVHMTNTHNTPIEALEQAYPVRIERYALAPAGAGNGGRGIVRIYRFLADAEVTLMGERRRQGAPGLGTTSRGAPGKHALIRASGERVTLPGKCTVAVRAGEAIEVVTPGGAPFAG